MRDGKVIGVVKNFQTGSFREKAEPMVFMVYTKPYAQTFVLVKLKAGSMTQAMKDIEKVFTRFDPVHPFDPILLDENVRKLYEAEIKMSRLFSVFASLTLFIACLGLLGLASFVTEQRTKEIGIRKVMGAPVSHIVLLVSKDFGKLVLIACVIAIPTAWYLMDKWLQDFATRTSISWWVFLLTTASTFLVAMLTVSFQTIQAATRNPVSTLRYE
jgi:putative ABC transport system permease protein